MTRLLKEAKLRLEACPKDVDYHHPRGLDRGLMMTLVSSEWIRSRQNLLVTGPTRTGKTYTACALGNAACWQGLSIRCHGCRASSQSWSPPGTSWRSSIIGPDPVHCQPADHRRSHRGRCHAGPAPAQLTLDCHAGRIYAESDEQYIDHCLTLKTTQDGSESGRTTME